MNEQVRARQFVAALHQDTGDAEHVITPSAGALRGKVVEIKFKVAGEFFRVDHELAIGSRGDRDIGRESDSGGHDEAVVVVGVFADQVDASGRAEDAGALAEELFEARSEVASCHCDWHIQARMPMQNGSGN